MESLTNRFRSHKIEPTDKPAGDQPAADDGGEPPASDSEAEANDPSYQARTYHLIVSNSSTFPIQMTAWPCRASKNSDWILSNYRGAQFHNTVPAIGTTSSDPTFEIGALRGPKHFDLRPRWGWVFFDLILPDRKIHLQAFLKLNRNGVETALLGRLDLDSQKDNPMPSGQFGSVKVEGTSIHLNIDASFKDVQNVVDDSSKKASQTIPGKGIEATTYVSSKLSRTSLIVGNEARYHEYEPPVHPDRLGTLRHSVHEVEGVLAKYIGAFVDHDGKPWFQGHVKVHPVTGIAEGSGFDNTARMTAVFVEGGGTVNYGFHDAGTGRRDQVYVYTTPDLSNWLGDLIAENDKWLSLPFTKLALAAAHDSGMYGPLNGGLELLIKQGKFGNMISSKVENALADTFVRYTVKALENLNLSPARVINNIALTQKDEFADQLKIGVRFFDFRPGYCFHDIVNAVKGEIYHQHAMVPGFPYKTFLTDVLNFLGTHPSEIVVVELKSDGFVVKADRIKDGKVVILSMIPTESELAAILEEARTATNSQIGKEIVVGGAEDMEKTIGELIDSKKRFIIIDKIHNPDAWPRADTYDHVAYNTDEPGPIIAMLDKTHAEVSKPSEPDPKTGLHSGTIYQLQATPTADLSEDLRASLTYSDSSSLLTYMKPRMDRSTYPWIASHTFNESGNVIFLNDFVDGVLVEHAIDVCRQRAGF